MSTIAVTFVEKTQNRNLNPPPTGSNVAAWAVAKFVQTPADGTYPTTQSPDATGTTDSTGTVTLSGLTSSDAYYVSIVDGAGMPHWTQPLIAGAGIANKLTYVPAPSPAAAPAGPAHGELIFRAWQSSAGDIGSTGSPQQVSFDHIFYDPLGGGSSGAFTVPAALVGVNLFGIITVGVSASAASLSGGNYVNLKQNNNTMGLTWQSIPAGSGYTESWETSGTNITPLAIGDEITGVILMNTGSWGTAGSGSGFYTNMMLFAV
jgi:hypothetical protein